MTGYRLRVRRVVEETADARSIVFEVPAELADRFAYRPGQFLTLRIPRADGTAVARCYSLASAPGVDADPKVTVKRVTGGCGSNWICDHLEPGQEVEVLPPAGTFTADRLAGDHLFLAGGSGITPVISIIKSVLAEPSGSAVLVYANRDERSVIFASELRELAERHPGRLLVIHLLETVQGLPTADVLAQLLAPFTSRDTAFVCGPAPFMAVATETLSLLGMARERVVVERFRSLTGDPFAEVVVPASAEESPEAAATVTVSLDGEQRTLPWPAERTLLELLLADGMDAPFSCKEGACSACACKLVSGEVKMLRNEVLEDEDLAEGWVLACQAVPISDEVEVSYD
ncbi:ferredoxin--NADP reductase [Pseudonocardia nigra]|uniref:ferredoxin--NADP reductase n=1 Tax=Pseudonocardia nigra TaxID=1921578 RepID=UPI001C5D503D|nr:ferredoxin--NADP reductase [Pseudonocardia nigra]